MADAQPKPASPALRILRWTWASLLIFGFAFSVLMAAWGDLREAVMLKLISDRYSKSMTIFAPHGATVWVGREFLGTCEPHALAAGEPEDSTEMVEGASVLLPRVYLREDQLMPNSIDYAPGDDTARLLLHFMPNAEILWVETDKAPDSGFVPALLRTGSGRPDFVNLGLIEWPARDGGFTRRAFILRIWHEDLPLFTLRKTRLWSDQIYESQAGFWATRDEYDGFPDQLSGQSKTVWQWHFEPETHDWLTARAPGAHRDWFKLPETK